MKGHAMRQLLLRMARVLAPVALVAALAASAGCASINPVAKAAQQPSHGSADGTGCTPSQRRAALAEDQRVILAKLGDLVTLRNQADAKRLAKIGYAGYAHWQTSLAGIGVTVMGDLMHQTADRPGMLMYRPRPGAPNGPHDGFDFPYRLAGWGYPGPYDWHQHPTTLLPCVGRAEWFIHERGIHLYDTGGFLPTPPKEAVRGTAAGADFPKTKSPDQSHPRSWDIHVWLTGSGVPTTGIHNPGTPIPGLDLPAPSFFHPSEP